MQIRDLIDKLKTIRAGTNISLMYISDNKGLAKCAVRLVDYRKRADVRAKHSIGAIKPHTASFVRRADLESRGFIVETNGGNVCLAVNKPTGHAQNVISYTKSGKSEFDFRLINVDKILAIGH